MILDDSMKVSVCMITYNHEKYIAQAIESVLMQETDFKYELIIGEDCSTDKTRIIIQEYGSRFPDRIKLFLNEKNLGGHKNLLHCYQACQGKYIALLEGDDYWTSKNKLQKQVDFLENHSECAICYHRCKIAREDNPPTENLILEKNPRPISKLEKLFEGNYLPTCSVLVRNNLIPSFPDWIYNYWFLDWVFHILNAQFGDIGFIDEYMGVYRIHSKSLTASVDQSKQYLDIISFLTLLDGYFNYQYTDIISANLSKNYFMLSETYVSENDIPAARRSFLQGLKRYTLKCEMSRTTIIKLLFKIYLSNLWSRKLQSAR